MYLPGKINKSTGSLANKTAKTKSISIISIEVHNPALDFTFEKKKCIYQQTSQRY